MYVGGIDLLVDWTEGGNMDSRCKMGGRKGVRIRGRWKISSTVDERLEKTE